MNDNYLYSYAQALYNDLGYYDYILAVYPKRFPHQRLKRTIFGRNIDTSFIYCAGKVAGRDVLFGVDIDGRVTEEKIAEAVKKKLHRNDCFISVKILEPKDFETVKHFND
ncbi:MAG: hypothetical protein LUC88_10195 [Prevotella sp.]|nr:hypothetical protein [Prevotella sp.]